MDKQLVVYAPNWVLLSHERRELPIHTTTWVSLRSIVLSEKKPGTKDHILYGSISMKFQVKESIEIEIRCVVV